MGSSVNLNCDEKVHIRIGALSEVLYNHTTGQLNWLQGPVERAVGVTRVTSVVHIQFYKTTTGWCCFSVSQY